MQKVVLIFFIAFLLPSIQLAGFDYGGFIAYEFNEEGCILHLTIVKGKFLSDSSNPMDNYHHGLFDSVEPIPIPYAAFTSYNLNNELIRQDTFDSIWDEDVFQSFMQPRLDTACVSYVDNPCLKYANYTVTIPCEELNQAEISIYQRGWLSKKFENILHLNQSFPVVGLTFFDILTEQSLAVRNSSPKLSFESTPYFCNSVEQDFLLPVSDKDGDSLVFRICEQWNGDSTTLYIIDHANPPPFYSVPYKSGFSYSSPMGENAIFEIDAETGNITIDTDSVGWYSVGICVDEYRDSVFLGDHYYLYPIFIGECENVLLHNAEIITDELEAFCYPFDMSLEVACDENFNYDWFYKDEFLGEGCFVDASIDRPGPINIYVEISNNDNCLEVIALNSEITIDTLPNAAFEVVLEADNYIQFINQSIASNFYLWDFGDGVLDINNNPQHQYANPGTYLITLIAKNNNECESIFEKEVIIEEKSSFFASNAFSPNGDGVNDTWHLISSNFLPANFKISIYNRWGEIIYNATDPAFEWTGFDKYNKPVSSGVYLYFIEYQMENKLYSKQGNVVLVN